VAALAVLRAVRGAIAHVLKSIPDYILKALGAFFRWYSRLSLVPMFITTAVIGVVAIVALGRIGIAGAQRTEVQHVIEGVLVAWFIVVLLVGMIRPGGR
jgi:hypothetical protein